MNVRGLLVIGLALVCGLSAVFLVKALRNPIATPVIERTGVVYAIENVKTGEMVSEASVEIRQIPTADVPEDAIRKTSDAIDRAAKSTIDKGDMLRELKLAEKGAGRGMAALIRPGMRAFTIQTPTFSSSLAGFLLPGNRVDVLLTSTPIGNGTEATNVTTSTLLQDVEILAVHTNVSTPTANKINPDEARSVTLSVTPEDAQRLDLGQNKGTLHLTLRNPNDKSLDKADPATLLDLLGARPAPVVLEAPKPIQVVGLASKITPGMRAVTLDSTSFSSPLAGYLVADNRVDVVLTSNPMSKSSQTNGDVGSKGVTIASSTTTGANSYQANDDPSGGAATTTIVENIRILEMRAKSEVPNPAQDNAGDGRSITLEVSPVDAEILDLAKSIGKLQLSLRSSRDDREDLEQREDRGPWRTVHVAGGLKMIEGPHILPKIQSKDQIRTLRGTQSGADSWTIYETTPRTPSRQGFPAKLAGAK